ncbi:uncharacterized protein LOC124987178 [Sciurus carolinensis]|uniref:uncharacterized protein LOC124987178 n=1 Tax=Sciurus carolinensis TaxID=30640 RepID=UPI001FB51E15|nr:uncharacterized protein LOC124987178 [Sciurus carolinensis]
MAPPPSHLAPSPGVGSSNLAQSVGRAGLAEEPRGQRVVMEKAEDSVRRPGPASHELCGLGPPYPSCLGVLIGDRGGGSKTAGVSGAERGLCWIPRPAHPPGSSPHADGTLPRKGPRWPKVTQPVRVGLGSRLVVSSPRPRRLRSSLLLFSVYTPRCLGVKMDNCVRERQSQTQKQIGSCQRPGAGETLPVGTGVSGDEHALESVAVLVLGSAMRGEGALTARARVLSAAACAPGHLRLPLTASLPGSWWAQLCGESAAGRGWPCQGGETPGSGMRRAGFGPDPASSCRQVSFQGQMAGAHQGGLFRQHLITRG